MKNRFNYFLQKDKKSGEIVLIHYNKLEGYHISPKTKKEDAIDVKSVVFVSPEFSEKIIKKKIEHKISYFLKQLQIIESDDSSDTSSVIKKTLMDAEKLKLNIIQNYVKYLGNTYQSLTLKKLQIIINELRVKLYLVKDMNYLNLYKENEEQERKGPRR